MQWNAERKLRCKDYPSNIYALHLKWYVRIVFKNRKYSNEEKLGKKKKKKLDEMEDRCLLDL